MGIEFIRKAAKSFNKGTDRDRRDLARPDLFTQLPTIAPRSYAATLQNGCTVTPGEKLGVHLDGQNVVALRGLDPIATFNSPSVDLKNALHACHGERSGSVLHVHPIAGIVEIVIC